MSGAPGDRHRPPKLAEVLLGFVLTDPETREGILGDLWEEYCEAARATSPHEATRWYWWNALGLGFRYAAVAVKGRRRSDDPWRALLKPGRARFGAALLQDLGYAARALGRRPGFTAVTTLTLGLGIGLSTAIFSVFNAIVLRPIPFNEPDRIVCLSQLAPQGTYFAVSQPDFLDYREQARSVLDLAAVQLEAAAFLRADDTQRLTTALTTSALFRVFQVSPALGRVFAGEEETQGRETSVAILSHGFWVRAFDSDASAIGATIRLSTGQFTVVGIMPQGFDVPGDVDVWLPRGASPYVAREDRRLTVFGRLRAGISLESARDEVHRIAADLGERYPTTNEGWGVRLTPLPEWVVGPQVRLVTLTLLSAVALLLLLISANLSNLLMAWTTTRHKEIGIRAAIGAGRWRVIRHILTESFLLGVTGALVGLLLAFLLIPGIAAQPEILPRLSEVDVDGAVLTFAALVSCLMSLAVGLAPGVQATRWKVQEALAEASLPPALTERRARDFLVVGEVALAMTLLVGAGLLGHSFLRLQRADRGFDVEGLLATQVSLPSWHGRAELLPLYEDALGGLRRIQGVSAAAATSLRFFDLSPRLFTELGRTDSSSDEYVTSDWRVVTDGYFRTAGVRLLAGRTFEGVRSESGDPEVIVNRTLASLLWPDQDPLGQQVRWEGPEGAITRVVGVVADVQDIYPRLPQVASAYVPYRQSPLRAMTLLVRSEGDRTGLARAIRREIRAVSAEAMVSEVRPIDDSYRDVTALDRFLALFLALVACVAVALAMLGLYALVSFTVARRSDEIGVRMALGGRPTNIISMVLLHGLRLVAMGIVIGVFAAVALSGLLSTLLFETAPTDPQIYLVVGVLLLVVSLLATYLPARRATKVDPRGILRV